MIGEGSYGKVFRGIDTTTGKEYALKVITQQTQQNTPELPLFIQNELEVLQSTQHAHIVKLIETFQCSNNLYLVYEYCDGGTLQDRLTSGTLPIQTVTRLFQQLLLAFRHLHTPNRVIIHRDLKPQNILFHQKQVKLADFGFCCILRNVQQQKSTSLGSPLYMAPEVLSQQPYDYKVDVWSLGVVVYEALYGHCPYEGNSISHLLEIMAKEVSFPPKVTAPPQMQHALARMLVRQPSQRASWEEVFGIMLDPVVV